MSEDQTLYLNLATAADLEKVDPIGDRAAAIVEKRPFHDWSDLRRAGMDQDAITAVKSAGAPGEGPIGEPGSGGSGGSPRGNLGQA